MKCLFLILFLLIACPCFSVPIGYGDCVLDSINPVGDRDTLTFTGTSGDILIVRMARISGDIAVRIEVYDPAWSKIADEWDIAYVSVDTLSLASTGSYAIVASDYTGSGTGPYGLSLQRTFNPGGSSPLGYGTTVEDSILLVTEMDAYTFSGSLGDVVTVRLAWASGTLLPYLQLFRPDGGRIGADWQYPKAVIDTLVLPETGQYSIIVCDQYGPWTGRYGLSVQRTSGPVGAIMLAYGEAASDSLYRASELKAYTFVGAQGDNITIYMTQPALELSPYLELFNPSGAKIAEGWGIQEAMIDTMPLPVSGTYTLLGSDYVGSQKGVYSLAVIKVEPGILEREGEPGRHRRPGLGQNRPNPFERSTVIDYSLDESGPILVEVYDLAGRKVARLVDGYERAGTHSVFWFGNSEGGSSVPSGVYLYSLITARGVTSRRMILLR